MEQLKVNKDGWSEYRSQNLVVGLKVTLFAL